MKIVGVVLLVGTAAFAAWQTLQVQQLQTQLDALQASRDKWNEDSQQQSDQYNKAITGLKQQLQDKDSQLETAKTQAAAARSAIDQLLANADSAAKRATVNVPRADVMASPTYRQALMQQQYMARYGGFVPGLKLPPEKEVALKNSAVVAMTKFMDDSREMVRKMNNGELTTQEEAALLKASGVRNDPLLAMAEYLSSEQMDALRAYVAEAPNRSKAQLANSMYVDLGSRAPGLTEATRTTLAAAYAEAMVVSYKPTPGQPNSRMSAVYAQMENSLHDAVSEDQIQIAREYLRNSTIMDVEGQRANAILNAERQQANANRK